ncbi:TadE family protein [Ideonella margarita]|uniref:TadE family protein n=1 Tax=Ideonella margarita TaxID=2984191 RepID=A0ABU9C7N6_9BURK
MNSNMIVRTGAARATQAGQSATEFLIALLVMLPLFLAVAYAGRYGEIHQTATQASRYAAFQRVMQPDSKVLSDAKIEDQMRARYFTSWKQLQADGHLQTDDTATKLADGEGQPWMWQSVSGEALLQKHTDAKLTWASGSLGSGTVAKSLGFMTKTAGKSYGGTHTAQVEVSLLNRYDQSTDTPGLLTIAAATAAVGDGLGSSGSKATRDAASTLVPTSKIPKALSGLLAAAIGLFEPHGPQLGCIKPDVVYNGRLDGAADNGKCW